MKAKRLATIDDLARARFERSTFSLDCDTKGCGARGVFDTIKQIGGWLIDGNVPGGPVLVLCPRCNARRKAAKP
jgi:hypothetical protein